MVSSNVIKSSLLFSRRFSLVSAALLTCILNTIRYQTYEIVHFFKQLQQLSSFSGYTSNNSQSVSFPQRVIYKPEARTDKDGDLCVQ